MVVSCPPRHNCQSAASVPELFFPYFFFRVRLARAAAVLTFFIGWLANGVLLDAQEDRRNSAVEPRTEENVQVSIPISLINRLKQRFPEKKYHSAVDFYETNAPWFLIELEETCTERPDEAKNHADQLLARMQHLLTIKKTRPDEYERLLNMLALQNRCLSLSRKIRNQRRVLDQTGRNADNAQLSRSQEELRRVLADIFTATQQNQLIEINRLEAEVREMRRMIQQREVNKESLLESRFKQMTED